MQRSSPVAPRRQFLVAEARRRVVVHEPDGLHERVADGRADEAEPEALEVLAHRLRFGGLRRDRREGAPLTDDRRSVHELPDIGSETAEVVLYLEDAAGVVHGRLDLEAVAHDRRIPQEPLDPPSIEARDYSG